jgi:hypothetical protein
MHRNRFTFPKIHRLAVRAAMVIGLLTVGALPFLKSMITLTRKTVRCWSKPSRGVKTRDW